MPKQDTTRFTDAMPIELGEGKYDKQTIIEKATGLYKMAKEHGDTLMMEVAGDTLKKQGAEIPT